MPDLDLFLFGIIILFVLALIIEHHWHGIKAKRFQELIEGKKKNDTRTTRKT